MYEYYAHISEDQQRKQTVAEHLSGTAELAEAFAKEFDAGVFGRLAGEAHDIGKYSEAFQNRLNGGSRVDHSSAGALECMRRCLFMTALCVAGHHGGLPNYGNQKADVIGTPTLIGRMKAAAAEKIPNYAAWPGKLPTTPQEPDFGSEMFYRSMWTRMLYSALVDADYLDTERFMRGGAVTRGGYATLPELLERMDLYLAAWRTPTTELNRLRNEVREDCDRAAEQTPGLFSLTVPTGGGKTVSSVSFALRHAVRYGKRRIIYVIPYTSIIEQNADVFRRIFGAENVLEHHAEAPVTDNEDLSEQERALSFATENWDAPIVVTTAVQFFDSMFSNRASKCRKLHNVANSVIVFDEAQMLPIEHLLPCSAVIGILAKRFRVSAVLCTATQPSISDLLERYAPDMEIREICHDVDGLFHKLKRTTFRNIGQQTVENLTGVLAEYDQVLCVVNTRKMAHDVYLSLPSENRYHLSTLMCPAHRKQTLQEIRSLLKAGKPCRVVSTSLIEAGVDISFPAVFRERAGLDSVIQAGGRCNREGKSSVEESVVSVFEFEARTPPLIRLNIAASREAMRVVPEIGSPKSVAAYFSSLRSLRANGIDVSGAVGFMEKGYDGCMLPFRTVAERFHLIRDETLTVYIPHEENEALLKKLIDGSADRTDYRMAGQYAVHIYQNHYQNLIQAGDIVEFAPGSAFLVSKDAYRRDMGLSLTSEEGKGIFC